MISSVSKQIKNITEYLKTKSDNLKDGEMMVYFFQVSQSNKCTLENFNKILGDDIPIYSMKEGTYYPYLFCIDTNTDVKKICDDNGFDVKFIKKQPVMISEYNSNYMTGCCYNGIYCHKLYDKNLNYC